MKKKISRLAVERETLRLLGVRTLTQVVAGRGNTDPLDDCFSLPTKALADDPKK